MVRYTPEQRLFIYTSKETGHYYPQIARDFQRKFNIPPPSRKACFKIHQKVSNHHTAHDVQRTGRHRSERTDDNAMMVYGDVMETPKLGTRKRAASLDLSRSTLQRILKLDLTQRAYHITRHQQLLQPDFQNRIDFANDFLAKQAADPYYEDGIWYTDEAHCHINGYINSQNAIHWGSEKPDEVAEKQSHPQKVTIWCAVSSAGVLGPYFYEENGRTVNVNGVRYLDVLQNRFYPDLSELAFNNPQLSPDWYFMQDGARPHIVQPVRTFLTTKFGTRTIGQYLNTHWPARSPDLTPCDFFLWGWVKDQLYKQYPIANVQQLKNEITRIIQTMDPTFATNACRSVKKRCTKLLAAGGRHFEHLL